MALTTRQASMSLSAVFLHFLCFGARAFGGPVAQIASLQQDLVTDARLIEPGRFRRALAVYQALPGPEAHEMCVWCGMVLRGRAGAIAAGLGFMLPGVVLMLLVAACYREGLLQGPSARAAMVGMQAAVLGVIARALVRLGTHTLQDVTLRLVGLGALLVTLSGTHFLPVLAAGGAFALLWQRRARAAALGLLLALAAWSLHVAIGDGAGAAPATAVLAAPPTTVELLLSGLRSGLLTFGGAYTAIPFLQNDAAAAGWMSPAQFLDGVALAGILPAPLIVFATFVGMQAGGWPGALAMTGGIFAPAFAFTLAGHGLFERITGDPACHRFLDGVTAAVVGIMAATLVGLAQAGITDMLRGALAIAALLVLWLWPHRLAVPAVMLAAGALGVRFA